MGKAAVGTDDGTEVVCEGEIGGPAGGACRGEFLRLPCPAVPGVVGRVDGLEPDKPPLVEQVDGGVEHVAVEGDAGARVAGRGLIVDAVEGDDVVVADLAPLGDEEARGEVLLALGQQERPLISQEALLRGGAVEELVGSLAVWLNLSIAPWPWGYASVPRIRWVLRFATTAAVSAEMKPGPRSR